MSPSIRWSVRRPVGWSVCHNFFKNLDMGWSDPSNKKIYSSFATLKGTLTCTVLYPVIQASVQSQLSTASGTMSVPTSSVQTCTMSTSLRRGVKQTSLKRQGTYRFLNKVRSFVFFLYRIPCSKFLNNQQFSAELGLLIVLSTQEKVGL